MVGYERQFPLGKTPSQRRHFFIQALRGRLIPQPFSVRGIGHNKTARRILLCFRKRRLGLTHGQRSDHRIRLFLPVLPCPRQIQRPFQIRRGKRRAIRIVRSKLILPRSSSRIVFSILLSAMSKLFKAKSLPNPGAISHAYIRKKDRKAETSASSRIITKWKLRLSLSAAQRLLRSCNLV